MTVEIMSIWAEFDLVLDQRPKFALGILFFGAIGLFASWHLFSSNKTLSNATIARFIGTSNPRAARCVCALCAIVCWVAVALFAATLIENSASLVRSI